MKLIKVLAEKSNHETVYTIEENATLREAAKKMTEKNVGALIVIEENKNPESYTGIITEKMFIKNCWKFNTFLDKKVKDIMFSKLLCTNANDDVNDVMNILTQERVRYAPVWDNGKLIGIVSIGDIIKTMHEEKKIKITYLSKMCGTYGNNVY
ncbi:MAG TPA: CBS domain-containing protein [Victivallales bacterium]|nr:CBS domain-containing protein [Victivallales bacterium]